MHEATSPEEKLLKLIRKKATASPQSESAKAGSHVAETSSPREGSLQLFKNLEKLFGAVIVVLLGYMVFELAFQRGPERMTISMNTGSSQKAGDVRKKGVVVPEPFEYYEQKMKKRDVFASVMVPKTQKPKTAIIPVADLSPQFVRRLKVVGIVLDENPEAIIEDLDEKRTYFLHQGDSISKATVKEILENKVILLYNGRPIELIP